jgi:hypothetical protein
MPSYLTALLITIAAEFFIYLIIIRKNPRQLFLYAVLINCLTQPAAVWAFNELTLSGDNNLFYIYFLIIELVVFLAETFLVLLLFRVKLLKALFISFSANLVTALLSFII